MAMLKKLGWPEQGEGRKENRGRGGTGTQPSGMQWFRQGKARQQVGIGENLGKSYQSSCFCCKVTDQLEQRALRFHH